MVPILYEKTATVFDRTTIIGRLAETISCTVTEELNGIYEAELELPTTAKHYPHIMLQSIIVLKPNENDKGQPFRVYKISKPLNGIVTIYLEHISYDLTRQTAMPFYAHGVSAAMAGLKNVTIGVTKFSFSTDKIDGETFSTEEPRTVRNILGGEDNSFVTKYGGDLEFDHYNVRLLRNRGKDNGVQIRYGKNLTDILAEDNDESVITACVPYYRDGEKTYWVSSTDGVVISSHYNGHKGTWQELIASGNETWQDVQRQRWSDFSSTGEEAETWQSRIEYGEHTWQDIQDKTWMDFMGGLERIQPLDVTSLIEKPEDADDDWVPTEGEIARAAENYMNEKLVWLASSTLEVSFVNLRDTEQYKDFAPLQNVGLCDTVHVIYNALGVNVSLKVVKTVYDGIRERYNDITLGNPKKTLAENIKRGFESTLSNITNEIEAKAGTQEVVDVVTKSQQEVKSYADNAATSAVNAQTQLDIFNRLTNNQSNQGIYLNGNNLYLNASLLKTGIITDGAGYQQWDLVNKLFTSGSSSGTKFEINQGVIFFYYNGDQTGTIHPVGGSDTRGKGVAFAALSPANGTSMGGAGIFNYSDGSCYLEGKDSSNKNDTDNATKKTFINSTAWRRYAQMDIPTGWASAGTAGTDGKAMSALYLRNGLYQMGNTSNNTYKQTCAGWISNGAKTMNFVVRLPMRLHQGQTFTLNHLRGTGKCGTSICFDLESTPASHESSNPLDWTALSDCTVSVDRNGIAEDEIFVSITGREAFKSGYRAGATVQNESALTFIINYIDFTIS